MQIFKTFITPHEEGNTSFKKEKLTKGKRKNK